MIETLERLWFRAQTEACQPDGKWRRTGYEPWDDDVKPTGTTEHEILVTLATMALKMDDLTGHDVIEALRELGHGRIVEEARIARARTEEGFSDAL